MNNYSILVIGTIVLVAFLLFSCRTNHSSPKKQTSPSSSKKSYEHGTGRTVIYKQGWEHSGLYCCKEGDVHSAMDIVERNRWLGDFAKVKFARTLGTSKTKDIISDGCNEFTYMIECWDE